MTLTDEIIFEKSERLNWPTTIAMVIFHAGAIAGLFFFTWKLFFITVLLYWATTGLGISLGYHRLHTHRSYKAPTWLDYTVRRLWRPHFRRWPYFLGSHTPNSSPEVRSRGRSAFTARWRLVGTRRLAPVWRSQSRQYPRHVKVCARSCQKAVLRLAE